MQNRVLPRNRQFLTVRELQGQGFSHYIINQMVEDGNLVKLNNKVYENTAYTGDASDFGYIAAYAPKGVVCLMSAARFYNLTTFLPDGIDIAIERSMKISTIPDWPLRFMCGTFPRNATNPELTPRQTEPQNFSFTTKKRRWLISCLTATKSELRKQKKSSPTIFRSLTEISTSFTGMRRFLAAKKSFLPIWRCFYESGQQN